MTSTRQDGGRGVFVAGVLANEPLCREHYRLVLGLKEFPPSRPGQFVQLQCRGLGEQASGRAVDWPSHGLPRLTQAELAGKEPLLRRPLSLGGRRDAAGKTELEIIYRVVGTGTRWLTHVRAGDELSLLGPLGNGFAISPGKPLAALVGGGVGIPPMLYLAQELAKAGRKTIAFSGARSAGLLPLTLAGEAACPTARPSACVSQFSEFGIESVVATDDGSAGFAGTVSEAFRDWLNAHLPSSDDLVVYSCGPEAMMRALADICLSRGIQCQVALERHMACGMGTCQSCIVKVRQGPDEAWAFKLCCTDGPVFDASELLW